MDEIKDVSNAVAETAKFGTKALDSGDKFGSFLSCVFGGSAEAAAGILEDKLECIRWERRIRMVDQVNKYREEKNIERAIPIPPKFAIPMIENATLEEDDCLQDIWCRLIANNLDSDHTFEMRYAFIELIKNLTVLDAKILKYFYDNAFFEYSSLSQSSFLEFESESNAERKEERILIFQNLYQETIKRKIDCGNVELDVSIHNLLRLRCLVDSTLEESISSAEEVDEISCYLKQYSLTPLGCVFIEACMK